MSIQNSGLLLQLFSWFCLLSALTDIFEKADVTRNGKITLKDYVNICVVYGIEVSEDEMLKIQVNKHFSCDKHICTLVVTNIHFSVVTNITLVVTNIHFSCDKPIL